MKKTLYILAFVAVLFTACKVEEPSQEALFPTDINTIIQPGDSLYHLNDFVATFMTEKGNLYENEGTYRTRSMKVVNGDTVFLFSVDTIPAEGPGIWIKGRITTDDYGGNFYKAIVIQEMVGNQQQALRLSVDIGSANGMYQMGQEILVRCNGLAVGKYANQPQLCVPSYNNNVLANSANQKIGWAPGRIPGPRFREVCYLIGTPDRSKLVYQVMTLDEIIHYSELGSDHVTYHDQLTKIREARLMDGWLVCIRDLHCTGEYGNTGQSDVTQYLLPANRRSTTTTDSIGNPKLDPAAAVFAPTTRNMNYPQSRVFAASDDQYQSTNMSARKAIFVSTSEYAKFAYYLLPDSNYVGDITGILGFYSDNARYDVHQFTWSISPRNIKINEDPLILIDDLPLYDKDTHIKWYPEEYQWLPDQEDIE